MAYISDNIDRIYDKLARDLFLVGEKVGNTKEMSNVKIVLTDINNNIVSIRGLSPSYLLGEFTWYFSGDNSLSFISQFSSFWNHLSDDGETCNSAYGHLIKEAYGFNQINKVVEILRADPNSRRAKINLNAPNPKVDTTKDEPCTMSLHFMIRDNKLNCTAVMRSNDIWFGFPYDVAFFTELQKYIADKLGVEYGEYTHFAVSLHMYDRDRQRLIDVVTKRESKPIKFNRHLFHKYLWTLYWSAKNDGKEGLMYSAKELGVYSPEVSKNG
jgi:thymidylate synthase